MNIGVRSAAGTAAAALVSLALLSSTAAAASVQGAKPEEVGFSSERLQRIHEAVQRHINSHDIAGAVTLVARRGRIVHFEPHGLMDLDSRKPMSKDSLFWIASMTKPVTGVAIMMLLEEGTLRLTDPVSRFIAEFRGLKVAVFQERTGPPTADNVPVSPFYTVPANREITIRDLLSHVSGLAWGTGASSPPELTKGPAEARGDAGQLHSAPGSSASRLPAGHPLGL